MHREQVEGTVTVSWFIGTNVDPLIFIQLLPIIFQAIARPIGDDPSGKMFCFLELTVRTTLGLMVLLSVISGFSFSGHRLPKIPANCVRRIVPIQACTFRLQYNVLM
jgi:hypothetical protein